MCFILPGIDKNLYDGKSRKTLRSVDFHLDDAATHNVKRSRKEIVRTKATRVVHLAYSLDAAPSDFFLFGYLKNDAGILSGIRRILQEISKETLVAVHDEWIT
jgi:hypothetical protein